MEYYDNIRNLRKKNGYTQEQLADKIGASRQSLIRWENGLNVPSLFYAQKMAECFGVEVSFLMNGEIEQGEKMEPTFFDGFNKYKDDVLSGTIFIIALSFLPVLCFFLFNQLIDGVAEYLSVSADKASGYVNVIFKARLVNFFLCLAASVLMITYWVALFIKKVRLNQDKYLRYRIYCEWNIGITVIWINLIVLLLYYIFSSLMMNLIAVYVGASLIAFFVDLLWDKTFKSIAKNWMVATKTPIRDRLNLYYIVVAGIDIAVMSCLMVYAKISSSFSGNFGKITMMSFFIAAGVIHCVYLLARLVLILKIYHQK